MTHSQCSVVAENEDLLLRWFAVRALSVYFVELLEVSIMSEKLKKSRKRRRDADVAGGKFSMASVWSF